MLQDITTYEQTQESLALLMILMQRPKKLQEGRSKPDKMAFADLRKRIKTLLRVKRCRVRISEDTEASSSIPGALSNPDRLLGPSVYGLSADIQKLRGVDQLLPPRSNPGYSLTT